MTVTVRRRPIAYDVLMHVLIFASNTVVNLAHIGGNVGLPTLLDPYIITNPGSVIITLASNLAQNQHLTDNLISLVTYALRHILIDKHHYYEATFKVYGKANTGTGGILIGSESLFKRD